jgi:hypothetical protein
MKIVHAVPQTVIRSVVLAALLAGSVRFAAGEVASGEEEVPLSPSQDCYYVGKEVATENGGALARATASQSDGQGACVIVLLIPAQGGQRPRREEVIVRLTDYLGTRDIKTDRCRRPATVGRTTCDDPSPGQPTASTN